MATRAHLDKKPIGTGQIIALSKHIELQNIDKINVDTQKEKIINEHAIDSGWMNLILSRKFCSRIGTILILLFLCILALCYSFAQIYSCKSK